MQKYASASVISDFLKNKAILMAHRCDELSDIWEDMYVYKGHWKPTCAPVAFYGPVWKAIILFSDCSPHATVFAVPFALNIHQPLFARYVMTVDVSELDIDFVVKTFADIVAESYGSLGRWATPCKIELRKRKPQMIVIKD